MYIFYRNNINIIRYKKNDKTLSVMVKLDVPFKCTTFISVTKMFLRFLALAQ